MIYDELCHSSVAYQAVFLTASHAFALIWVLILAGCNTSSCFSAITLALQALGFSTSSLPTFTFIK